MAGAKPDTNTLHVELPKGMSLNVARSAFSRFGDISNIELLPGAKHAARVVYFDVRAAAAATAAFGKNRCVPAPQTGCRLARLSGSVHLSAVDIPLVSGVINHPSDEGCFMVEFYDIRDAQRVQEMTSPDEAAEHGRDDEGRAVQASLPDPAYVQPLCSAPKTASSSLGSGLGAVAPKVAKEPKNSASREAGASVEVKIRGLPQALCSAPCMEVVLEQAGLDGRVVGCRVRRGVRGAEAVVTLVSRHAAGLCVKHFHGRRWGESTLEVTACIDEPGVPAQDRRVGSGATHDRSASKAEQVMKVPARHAAASSSAASRQMSLGMSADFLGQDGLAKRLPQTFVPKAAPKETGSGICMDESTTDDSCSERSCAEEKLAVRTVR